MIKPRKKVDPFFLNWNEANAFQMHVSGIQPGMRVYYEIRYTQIMKPVEGIYTLTLPKPLKPYYLKILDVVPLYRDTFSDTSFAELTDYPAGRFTSIVRVSKGGVMHACTAKGFDVKDTESEYTCTLTKAYAGEQLSVSYQFANTEPRENLMLYEDNNDKFFLLTLHPPTTKKCVIQCMLMSISYSVILHRWKRVQHHHSGRHFPKDYTQVTASIFSIMEMRIYN